MEGRTPIYWAISRRHFIRAGIIAGAMPLVGRRSAAAGVCHTGSQDSLAGRDARGSLRDPDAAGRPRQPTDPRDDAEIQAIEQRLACTCGCTLDIFTCRTTDFTCTYSPELHREVLALRESGNTAQQILDAFVAKYGEKALMAPKPEGFNLAGYLVPGALIAAAGAGLLLFIGRRKAVVAAASEPESSSALPAAASAEELERLRRELADVED
jgi:cytochrome c-type biogenesis protein CcmH